MPLWTDPRPKVLLTGFGPFPGVRKNVSTMLVRWLVRDIRVAVPHFRFVAAVLPTEWERAPLILSELYSQYDPVLALHFGVASGMRGFRIETEARNFCRMVPDAANKLPRGDKVVVDGPLSRPVTIDTKAIVQHLDDKGFYATLSDDAGGYLCNAVLYHSLVEAERRGGRCHVGFVHVPADASRGDILWAAEPGVSQIVKFVLGSSGPFVA